MTVEGFNQDEGAVVVVDSQRDDAMVRAASILLDVPGGFAWIEPSFLSPIDVRSGHRIDATEIRQDGDAIAFEGPVYSGRIERPDADSEEGRAIAWARDEMARRGLTVDAERERFRQAFTPDAEDVDA